MPIDNRGTSLILCNTAKGYALFKKILEGKLFYGSEVSLEDVIHLQNGGLTPYECCVEQRKQAWTHFYRYGLLYTLFVDFERKRFITKLKQKFISGANFISLKEG